MKKLVFLLSGIAALLAAQSCQQNKHAKNYNQQEMNYSNKTSVDDQGLSLIKNGLEGGLTEIRASSLAKTHSSNPRIISFAGMMITDHTKVGNELKKIEADKQVQGKDVISDDHKHMIANLSSKSGVEFDRAYMQMMVNDHEQAVKLFSDAAENKSATIHDFAKKTLPVIQMHLDSARAINASLK
jgi:putative membrane protein